MVARKAKYRPIDDVLDKGVALVQAATIVDIAMAHAIEHKDIDLMVQCLSGWLQISDRLGMEEEPEVFEEDEEGIQFSEEKFEFGFSPEGRKLKDVAGD